MRPTRLSGLMEEKGMLKPYSKDEIFHSQDFVETMFMLKTGYVKRCQTTKLEEPVIELIYGPGHIFPLSQLYRILFDIEMNQEELIYVYQAMTDIEIYSISDEEILSVLSKDKVLYEDLFYEAGLRLKSNINRLASNAIKENFKKIAHLLACLAEEFGSTAVHRGLKSTKIMVPLTSKDIAEQLNMFIGDALAIISSLDKQKIIKVRNDYIYISDLNLLRDAYL